MKGAHTVLGTALQLSLVQHSTSSSALFTERTCNQETNSAAVQQKSHWEVVHGRKEGHTSHVPLHFFFRQRAAVLSQLRGKSHKAAFFFPFFPPSEWKLGNMTGVTFAIYCTWTADATELQEWVFQDFLHPGKDFSKQESEHPHKWADPAFRKRLAPCRKPQ